MPAFSLLTTNEFQVVNLQLLKVLNLRLVSFDYYPEFLNRAGGG